MSFSRETSPDPLIASQTPTDIITHSSPTRAGAAPYTAKTGRPLRESNANVQRSPSPVKQQRTIIFSTPTKSPGWATGIASSPLRIKVTVEAAPESAGYGGKKTTATTTKIPLKGEDEHVPLKRKRTPRKSTEPVNPANSPKMIKAKATAKKQKSGDPSLHLNDNEGVAKDSPLMKDDSQNADNMPRATLHKSLDEPASVGGDEKSPAESITQRARRNVFTKLTPLHGKTAFRVESLVDQKIKARVLTPGKPRGHRDSLQAPAIIEQFVNPAAKLQGPGTTHFKGSGTTHFMGSDDKDEDEYEALNGGYYVESGSSGEKRDSTPSDDTAALDRSLAESEGFTMISLESLRNQQDKTSSGLERLPSRGEIYRAAELATSPTHLDDSCVWQADQIIETMSAQVQSNVPQQSDRLSQLRNALSSKAIPTDSEDGSRLTNDFLTSAQKRKSVDLDIFAGFGSGTKRRLRAHVAMGELLARNEPGFRTSTVSIAAEREQGQEHDTSIADDFQAIARLPTPADTAEWSSSPPLEERAIDRGFVQRKQSRDEMSWEPEHASNQYKGISEESISRLANNRENSVIDAPPMVIEGGDGPAEAQWTLPVGEEPQQGREVDFCHSRQVENSPMSQSRSNIIQSGETKDTSRRQRKQMSHGYQDIWLEEANSSLENSTVSQETHAKEHPVKPLHKQSLNFKELFGEDIQPQRSKLPRTWRRTSGNHFLYSDENPSPVQGTPHSLFERDLKGVDLSGDVEQPLPSIEESPALQRSQSRSLDASRSLKAISSIRDDRNQHVFEADLDEQYYSSEGSSTGSQDEGDGSVEEDLNANHDIDATFFESHDLDVHRRSKLDTNDVRQIHRETFGAIHLGAVSRSLAPASVCDRKVERTEDLDVLRPDPKKQYTRLFGDVLVSSESPRRHMKSETQAAKPRPDQKPTTEATRGIFARLYSWLYPPTQIWDRNHFYLLEHHWKAVYPTPLDVLLAAQATYSSPAYDDDNIKEIANLPLSLQQYHDQIFDIRNPDRRPRAPAMLATARHLHIAHAFMLEAAQRGIPLLSDGCLREQRPSTEFPKRDKDGRVVRVKQIWSALDTLRMVYGLWARDIGLATESCEREGRSILVNWPAENQDY